MGCIVSHMVVKICGAEHLKCSNLKQTFFFLSMTKHLKEFINLVNFSGGNLHG